ncbi:hypothetical protein P8452_47348 [Trifolium repens]|nr:hypothetical protein P8452_47348 [Trifolium repens]
MNSIRFTCLGLYNKIYTNAGSYEFGVVLMPESIRRNYIHRIVCAIALGQLLLLACGQLFIWCCIYRMHCYLVKIVI